MSVSARLHGLRARRSNVGVAAAAAAAAAALGRHRIHLNHFISREKDAPDTAAGAAGSFTLAVKDNIVTRSLPTTCASAMLAGYVSPYEATVVTQLRGLGARVVGKTNLDEFGMGSHNTNSAAGAALNGAGGGGDDGTPPRSAGGSSGGSAAAVAAGDADVALGTDTGGSVRLPAAYNAVVGFKPSYGMLSRRGLVPYANSLDTVGLLARSARRVAGLVACLWRHHDPLDPTSLPLAARLRCARAREGYAAADDDASPLRQQQQQQQRSLDWSCLTFGVPLECNIEELDPGIRAAWAAAASLLQALGARVVPASLPSTRHALSAYYVLAPAEASSNLAKYDGVRYGAGGPGGQQGGGAAAAADDDDGGGGVLYAGARGAGFGDEVRRRILLGSYSLSSGAMDNYFVQAQRVRRLVRADFDRAFRLGNPLLEHGGDGGGVGFDSDPEAATAAADVVDLADLPEDVPLADKRGPARVDFLLCPTAPTPPPTLDEAARQTSLGSYVNDVFTVPASLAGLPAVSIPVRLGGGDDSMDVDVDASRYGGLQLTGQYWDDARLLHVAAALRLELGRAGMDPRAARDESREAGGEAL
ncbi:hypothetical protein RB598_007080 [Gaeumannomyces tritici]